MPKESDSTQRTNRQLLWKVGGISVAATLLVAMVWPLMQPASKTAMREQSSPARTARDANPSITHDSPVVVESLMEAAADLHDNKALADNNTEQTSLEELAKSGVPITNAASSPPQPVPTIASVSGNEAGTDLSLGVTPAQQTSQRHYGVEPLSIPSHRQKVLDGVNRATEMDAYSMSFVDERNSSEWNIANKVTAARPGEPRRREGVTLGDRYAAIHDNAFIVPDKAAAVSTFSIDVDTASYTNVRQFILQSQMLPPPDAVRIEELINYFDYSYDPPKADAPEPFATDIQVARCPWQSEHLLARVAIKGRELDADKRPKSNLVFLVDVSGSMDDSNKLPLVVAGLRQLAQELSENDRVAIVVYASAEGLALPSTNGTEKATILAALDRLNAGGSTAGGAGIELAYKIAQQNFIPDGVNRVILCTDGDFNVGVSDTEGLQRLAEQKAAEADVFLTVLGFGRGNLNDEMMETISNKGNGNYHYIDNLREARKVLIEEMSATLVTIAKDVKIQIEFNPSRIAKYRLIGYENRMLNREDFDDDTKDAGEVGAGHTVTALYELVPLGAAARNENPDATDMPLKYQQSRQPKVEQDDVEASEFADELFTLRLRYKPPTGDRSTKIEFVALDEGRFPEPDSEFRFAAAVASFGMILRQSPHLGNSTFESAIALASESLGQDPHGYRAEFVDIIRAARKMQR